MKNQSISPKIVYHIVFPLWVYLLIYGLIIAAICGIAEGLNNLFRGGLLKWANEMLVSYWHLLNAIFSFVGWKRGFGSFWNVHPQIAVAIFLAIPMLGIIATISVLKRERLATQIIFLLYAWHYGLSSFVNANNIQLKILLILGTSVASLILGFRLVCFSHGKICSRNDSTSYFNNVGNRICSLIFYNAKNMTHSSNYKRSS